MDIGLAPRNGDLIVLRDALSGVWTIGRWADASEGWVDVDGQPLRLVPTHWQPVAGEAFGQTRSDNWFIVKAIAPTVFAATRYPSFRILFSAAVMLVAIYATSGFRLTDRWPFQALHLNKIAVQPDSVAQHQIAELARDLARARAGAKLSSERADTAQAELRDATRTAEAKLAELTQQLNDSTTAAQAELRETKHTDDAKLAELTQQLNNSTTTTQAELRNAMRAAETKQTELKQRLSNATAQTDKLTQDMAAELDATRRRADDAHREARQFQQAAKASDAKAAASRQALDEAAATANALESEVMSLRTTIASAAAAKAAETVAKAAAPPADEPALSASVSSDRENATAGKEATASISARDKSTVAMAVPQPAAVTTLAPPSEAPSTALPAKTISSADKATATSVSVNDNSAVAMAPPQPAAATTLTPHSETPSTALPTKTISSADEARLLARAQSLLQQLDFASARLLLENGIDRGSTQAIALLAATYDAPTIHRLHAYGIKPDPEKARVLYTQAAAFGIADARQRLEALSAGKP